MRPQTDPARRCLAVAEWPASDRAAWDAALRSNDLLAFERSTAASWKAATCHKNRRGYGRWLTFLRNSPHDLSENLADRVTRKRIAAYLLDLQQQHVAAYTLRNRILELYAVMIALAPDRDWSWLRGCVVHLNRNAQDTADRSLPSLLAADVLNRATKELRRRTQVAASWRDAIAYRNWLMVLTFTVLPIRLRNFAALSLRHLDRRADAWWVDIDGSETKNGRPHSSLIPGDASSLLDHYLICVRPQLAQALSGNSIWLTRRGTPLAPHTIYTTITELTKRAFGMPLNPHLFRRIFATSVSIADPEAIEGARAALGHATSRTTQDHYNRASALTAARTHANMVQRLRARTNTYQ